ncbi:MFS transporter [soil metagenome]
MKTLPRATILVILVAALGYFVDIYDLLLFGIVRRPSLIDLGVAKEKLLDTGVFLDNMQMGAMLLGGIFWGVLGDKRGRLSVLFGSIVLYSIANIGNGFVQTVPQYAALRFFAGFGLAGELGAGITLVSESLPAKSRGVGTTIVAAVGITGAIVAALVGKLTHWRTSYFIGGGLGLALLLLRVGVLESGLFAKVKAKTEVTRGNFFALFASRARVRRYLSVIVVGVPIWYCVGILVKFSDALGGALHMPKLPEPAMAIMYCYIGLALGDVASGLVSQRLKSRRRAIFVFLSMTTASLVFYFLVGPGSLVRFYVACGLIGFSTGYWAVFVTTAAEQFGTNLRATATTTIPNFVRGATVPMTLAFTALKVFPSLGVAGAALCVGVPVMILAFVALWTLDESYGKELDFVE